MFLLTALTIVSFSIVTYDTAYKDIELIAEPVCSQISQINTKSSLENYIRYRAGNAIQISVISSSHQVIYDTNFNELRKIDLSYKTIWEKIDNNETYSQIENIYVDATSRMLTYYTKVNSPLDENGYFYVRFSTSVIIGTQPFWILLVSEILFLVIVVVSLGFILNSNISSSLEPLGAVQGLLERVNEGKYIEKAELYKTSNEDVNNMLVQIDKLSSTIADSLTNLKNEKLKSEIILESISQGVLGFSKDLKVLIYNDQAKNIFEINEVNEDMTLSLILNDPIFEENIKMSQLDREYRIFEMNRKDCEYRIEIVFDIVKDEFISKTDFLLIVTDISIEYNDAKLKNEFFANASHELKTPLTAITGYSELLMMSENKKQTSKCSLEINKNAARMKFLIDEMLLLSKLDANNEIQNLDLYDLSTIVNDVFEELKVIANKKSIAMSVDGDVKYNCNYRMMKIVIKNLVSNAIKYSKENTQVTICIREDTDIVTIEVKDQGIGIAKENIDKIFERFYKVDSGRSIGVDESSTGLGLSIVKKIIENIGATIKVESELGKGSSFIVTLKK